MSKNEIPLRNQSDVLRAIATLTQVKIDPQKTDWTFVLKPFENDRSLAQNRLLHMWIKIVADDNGADAEWVKNEFKRRFLGYDFHKFKNPVTKTEEIDKTLKSTSKLKVKEFTLFLEKILSFCATDLGITLPVPEDLKHALDNNEARP